MKICVIGDSHTGALKRGWDRISSQYPETSLTFFSAGGNSPGFESLVVEDGSLAPFDPKLKKFFISTSNGLHHIQPSVYDVLLVYALWCYPYVSSPHGYSDQVMFQALKDFYENSMSMSVVNKLKTLTQEMIYVGHNPLPLWSERLSREKRDYPGGIHLSNRLFFNSRRCHLMPQPEATYSIEGFTHERYLVGSKRFFSDSALHPVNDRVHMNDEYGELWVKTFLTLCGG